MKPHWLTDRERGREIRLGKKVGFRVKTCVYKPSMEDGCTIVVSGFWHLIMHPRSTSAVWLLSDE